MHRRSLHIVAVLGLILVPISFSPALNHMPAPIDGTDELRQAENMVYAQDATTEEIRESIRSARDRFARADRADEAARAYWIARADLLLATHFNLRDDKRGAERAAQAGFDAIETALHAAGEFSDGLRVRSDLHSQMMFARGLFYMIRNGTDARDGAMRALELDPDNLKAQITVAGFYMNAPPVAGGDTDRARLLLLDALERRPENVNDRFVMLGLLAQLAIAEERPDEARRYLAAARAIHPQNSWIAELEGEAAAL